MGMCPLYNSDESHVEEGTEEPPESWDPGTVPATPSDSDEAVEGTEEYERAKVLFELRMKEGDELKTIGFPKGITKTNFRVDFTNRPIGCRIIAVEPFVFEDISCFMVTYENEEKAELSAQEHHGTAVHGGMLRVRQYWKVLAAIEAAEQERIRLEEERKAEEARLIEEARLRAEEEARLEAERLAAIEKAKEDAVEAFNQALETGMKLLLEAEEKHKARLQQAMEEVQDPGLTPEMVQELSREAALNRLTKLNPPIGMMLADANEKTITTYLTQVEAENGASQEFTELSEKVSKDLEEDWTAVEKSYLKEIADYNAEVEFEEAKIVDYDYALAEKIAMHMGKDTKGENARKTMELRWEPRASTQLTLMGEFAAKWNENANRLARG